MKIVFDASRDYDPKRSPWAFIDILKYSEEDSDTIFAVGYTAKDTDFKAQGFKHTIFFNGELPGQFQLPLSHAIHSPPETNWHFDVSLWDKILSLCPYSTKWLNAMLGEDKHIDFWCPMNPDCLDVYNVEKIYDVSYQGCAALVAEEMKDMVKTIQKFNHALIGFSKKCHPDITIENPDALGKLTAMAQSKISISVNLLFSDHKHDYNDTKQYFAWDKNEAFSHLDEGIIPQLKWRNFEAAFAKSLLLVRKDYWNVIERYFTPEVHFRYYEKDKLEEKINECLSEWDYCEKITENAHSKVITDYTVDKWFETILNPIEAELKKRENI